MQVERLGGGTYGDVYRAVEEPEEGVGGGETFAVKYYVDETRTVTEDGLGCTTIRELSTISVSGVFQVYVQLVCLPTCCGSFCCSSFAFFCVFSLSEPIRTWFGCVISL